MVMFQTTFNKHYLFRLLGVTLELLGKSHNHLQTTFGKVIAVSGLFYAFKTILSALFFC